MLVVLSVELVGLAFMQNDPINENAWARLASDTAEPGGAADDDEGEARGDDAKDLWEEFQNREQQQAQRVGY